MKFPRKKRKKGGEKGGREAGRQEEPAPCRIELQLSEHSSALWNASSPPAGDLSLASMNFRRQQFYTLCQLYQSFGSQTHPKDCSIMSAGSTCLSVHPRKPGTRGGATCLFQSPEGTQQFLLKYTKCFHSTPSGTAWQLSRRSSDLRTKDPGHPLPQPRPLWPPGKGRKMGWVGWAHLSW